MINIDYLDLLYDVVSEDQKINELLDKSLERYLDANQSADGNKLMIKAYRTIDELDDLELMKATGYKNIHIDYYKNLHLSIFIFEKPMQKLKNSII